MPPLAAQVSEYQGHARTRPACQTVTHAAIPADVVRLPRRWIRRRSRGVWNCPHLVPPEAIVSVSLPLFAGSAA